MASRATPSTLSLKRALLLTVASAIVIGMLPAGIALDRRLASALEARTRLDLSLAPRVLADRSVVNADRMMMHAKDFAHSAGLADAMARADRSATLAVVSREREALGNAAIVVGTDGRSWTGPAVDSVLVARTRRGEMPVAVRQIGAGVQHVALAPVLRSGQWVGAAGLVAPIDDGAAGVLSGLTRSDVVIVSVGSGMIAASTLDTATTAELVRALGPMLSMPSDSTRDVVAGGQRRIAVIAPLGDAGMVVFSRSVGQELAVLPQLRRVAGVSVLAGLALTLVLAVVLSARVARPVQQLSDAADAITRGEFHAPLPSTRIREVANVSDSFAAMRQALALRLEELRSANDALVDRNARLTALQADLMQRDRLAAAGRLVAQLAHEIRNPVANLRNCLELIRRRVTDDAEAREFTDLAIDELLRMHELAEQMLDLHRPRDAAGGRCHPGPIARDVTTLASLGQTSSRLLLVARIEDDCEIAMAPDALKQILLNLIQNAREAAGARTVEIELELSASDDDVTIEVRDDGPGIAPGILSRVFDPFFTTKESVHGVGLGLFVAEGLVRSAGGTLTAGNRSSGGAWFRVTLPLAPRLGERPTTVEEGVVA